MPVYQEIWDGPANVYRKSSSGQPVTSRKKYITIHNTSNDATAEGEAAYAKVRTNASSHYYCDNNSIIQSLNTDWCAGHVGSTEGNTFGIAYEITGFNGWTRAQWLANVAWNLLAATIARDCMQFGIPVRQLTIAEMKANNQAGFVTHDQCRIAWGGTTHTDPGPGFPMDHLLTLVQQHLSGTTTEGPNPMILIKTEADPTVYVGDGINYRPMSGTLAYPAFQKAIAAGLKLITVSNMEELEALAGKPATDPAPVRLDTEQLAKLTADVTAALLAGMPKPLKPEDVRAVVRSEIDAVRYAPQRTGS